MSYVYAYTYIHVYLHKYVHIPTYQGIRIINSYMQNGILNMFKCSFTGGGVLLFLQSCPTLWDPMDCAHQAPLSMGILQARTLEWVAMPSSRGSSQPRDRTKVFCIADRFFTVWATGEALVVLHIQ